ncbi:MAG: hypothetical protein FJ316_09365 [SAR202 cluster bacterium]|nr:hypothetical protein [SAR202 cluster bacterium]
MNVISSLVNWISLAKQKLRESQLKDLLELYLQSGHSRPGLRELLLHLQGIVAPAPEAAGSPTSEWMDLMFQLHGILTGGLPIGKIPPINLEIRPTATNMEQSKAGIGPIPRPLR